MTQYLVFNYLGHDENVKVLEQHEVIINYNLK